MHVVAICRAVRSIAKTSCFKHILCLCTETQKLNRTSVSLCVVPVLVWQAREVEKQEAGKEGDPAKDGQDEPEGDPAKDEEEGPEGDPAKDGEEGPEGDPATASVT